jgi:sugar phosphate permease
MFGSMFSVRLHKKVSDFVLLCGLLFGASALLMTGITAGTAAGSLWIAFGGFAAVCFLMTTCNSVITSMFPMFMKGKMNSGMLAGVLNGFCYVGSTVSSYGLGAVADHFGWSAVFTVLTVVCVGCVALTIPYLIVKRVLKKA